MAFARSRAPLAVVAVLALLAGGVQGSAPPGDACASCRSLLSAVQRSLLDDGWAREQLLSTCAAQAEGQVRAQVLPRAMCKVATEVLICGGAAASRRPRRSRASAWRLQPLRRSSCGTP